MAVLDIKELNAAIRPMIGDGCPRGLDPLYISNHATGINDATHESWKQAAAGGDGYPDNLFALSPVQVPFKAPRLAIWDGIVNGGSPPLRQSFDQEPASSLPALCPGLNELNPGADRSRNPWVLLQSAWPSRAPMFDADTCLLFAEAHDWVHSLESDELPPLSRRIKDKFWRSFGRRTETMLQHLAERLVCAHFKLPELLPGMGVSYCTQACATDGMPYLFAVPRQPLMRGGHIAARIPVNRNVLTVAVIFMIGKDPATVTHPGQVWRVEDRLAYRPVRAWLAGWAPPHWVYRGRLMWRRGLPYGQRYPTFAVPLLDLLPMNKIGPEHIAAWPLPITHHRTVDSEAAKEYPTAPWPCRECVAFNTHTIGGLRPPFVLGKDALIKEEHRLFETQLKSAFADIRTATRYYRKRCT